MNIATRYEIINDFERFCSLRESWNDLVKQTEVDHAYMRHEWFECWIKSFGQFDNLWIFTAWSGDKLTGIAPGQIVVQKMRGVPVKTLTFLYSSIAPRCNFILHDELNKSAFFQELIRSNKAHLIEFRGLQSGLESTSEFLDCLSKTPNTAFIIEPGRTAPYTIISDNWEEYYNNLPSSYKRNIRASGRRLEKAGSFRVERIDCWVELQPLFDQLVEVSANSWKATDSTDFASLPHLANFYKSFCEMVDGEHLWECFLLFIDDKLVAFDFLLKHGNCRSGIRSDFDQNQKYYMPGIVLRTEALKTYHANPEPIEYDFVGIMNDHKKGWTDRLRDHVTVTVNTSGSSGRALLWAKRTLIPLARFGLRYDPCLLCGKCLRMEFSQWPQWYCGKTPACIEDSNEPV